MHAQVWFLTCLEHREKGSLVKKTAHQIKYKHNRHMSDPSSESNQPSDRIVVESTNVLATVSFWKTNFVAVCAINGYSGDMEIDHSTGGSGKKRPLGVTSTSVGVRPGCRAAVRLNSTAVLDITDVSASSGDGQEEEEESADANNGRRTRRKSPFDSIIVHLSGSQVLDAIDRFKRNGTLISKVTDGTYGRGKISRDDGRGNSSNDGRYVSVHFCTPDGRWCELRTEDAAKLDEIREAALPSIQDYLRGIIHG